MDGQNNEGGAAEEKNDETEEKEDNPTNSNRNKGSPGPPGFLFAQPKQRKKEYWQCIKLVAPTMESKTWKASEAIFAWCTICNCKVKWKTGETNPVKVHMESNHKRLLRAETMKEICCI